MKIRLEVLGCSGGIGGGRRTTALRVDDDILIDGGTGVGDLTLPELARIEHVFLTHAHLDHIACIPLMVDSVGHLRDSPLTLYATEATLAALKSHIFNDAIWPDFSRIPDAAHPFLRYQPTVIGTPTHLAGRNITPIPAVHVVPAVGYHVDSGHASLIFTGDTACDDELWEYVNRIENLRYLLIESAFAEQGRDIAVVSKHLCPSLLREELRKLHRPAEIYISHLKPGSEDATISEIQAIPGKLSALHKGQVFEF